MLCLHATIFFLLVAEGLGGVANYAIPRSSNTHSSTYFDVDAENSRLIVGATNMVFNLDFDLEAVSNIKDITVSTGLFDSCVADYFDRTICHNFHHLVRKMRGPGNLTGINGTVHSFTSLVLMCSSNAYIPQCTYRKVDSLEVVKQFRVGAYIPPEVNPPMPNLLLDGNVVMTAPAISPFSRRLKVVLPKSSSPFISETQKVVASIDDNWFVEPDFVSLEEIGDFIYIFFREKAKEIKGTYHYSRVSRVCKSDSGTLNVESVNLYSTYEKARITCDSGSSETFFYNQIRDTYYSKEEGRLYAIFNSDENGPAGSAMCSYSINTTKNDLFRVFDGIFYNQARNGSLFFTNVHGNSGCNRLLSDALNYQLIANRTQPVSSTPVIKQDGYTFHRIVAPISVNGYNVMFVTATKASESNGDKYLLKYIKRQSTNNYSLLQSYALPGSADQTHITQMMLHGTGKDALIFIGTTDNIYRVPVQSCNEHSSCEACMESSDPFCQYNSVSRACEAAEREVNASGGIGVGSTSPALCKMSSGSTVPMTSTLAASGTPGSAAIASSPTTAQTDVGITLTPSGLDKNGQDSLRNSIWIIVGSVGGFVVGLVMGVVILAFFSQLVLKKGKVRCASAASSCELADGSRNNSIHGDMSALKIHSVIVNQTNPSPEQQQQVTKNNATGNNFLRTSRNNYSNPPDKSHLAPGKKLTPSPPLKSYPSISPTKSSESDDSGIIGGMSKCSDVGTPSPKLTKAQPPPQPPQSSGYRQQGTIFRFDPTSIKNRSSPLSERRATAGKRGTDPNLASESSTSTLPRRGTDPSIKLNSRENMHPTNQQRHNYGQNILTRCPSIDDSKTKYISTSERDTRRPTQKQQPPAIRPRTTSMHREWKKGILKLEDVDGGSSQC